MREIPTTSPFFRSDAAAHILANIYAFSGPMDVDGKHFAAISEEWAKCAVSQADALIIELAKPVKGGKK